MTELQSSHAVYYAKLEQGARYLASRTPDEDERQRHLGWANRYQRLRVFCSEDR